MEIKFRAWNKRYNIMSYCGEGEYDTDTQGQILDCFDIVMQYIGITDKNGVEVYEDDQIKYHGCSRILQCVFIRGSYCFISDDMKLKIDANRMYDLEYEVIGNIHENPDLLSKNKDD